MLKPQKPPKAQMKIQFCVFLWITFLNVIVQIFQPQLQALHFHSWAFFMVNIMFFLNLDIPHLKQRYIEAFCGSVVGILLAAGLVVSVVFLEYLHIPYLVCVSIPMIIALALLIMMKPVLPVFFNNYGFAYLMIAIITPKTAVSNLPYYLISVILGHIIATGGSIMIMMLIMKHLQKKQADRA